MDYESAWKALKTLLGVKASVWRKRAEGDWPKPDKTRDVARLLAEAYETIVTRMDGQER